MRLGKSKLTINGYGCFVCSLATLYQKHPLEILKIPNGVTDSGLVNSNAIAKGCGGEALPKTTIAPKGWCIAMTDNYSPQGYPTHFFMVNAEKKLQIDPLDYPTQAEPLVYKIVEYRPFTNIKYITEMTWEEEAQKWATENGIISGGWDNPNAPMSQVRIAAALKNFKERFISS